MTSSRSNLAPGSVGNLLHSATALSHSAPCGEKRRPLRYANVFASGAIMPARAPASMLMLHTVIRPSIESERMAEPAYSTTQPVAPSVPICPMIERIMSLAVTPPRAGFPRSRSSPAHGHLPSLAEPRAPAVLRLAAAAHRELLGRRRIALDHR